jgi:hypothetical protein
MKPGSVLSAAAASGPLLSIVVCTWNRGPLLRRTLESILSTNNAGWTCCELLVVNNNSTDDTASILEEFKIDPRVRVFFAPEPGLSHARNLGVAKAQAPWILFLDDDVEVDSDFFIQYATNITVHADHGFFGGPIIPHFSGPHKRWTRSVLASHGWIYSCIDLGPVSNTFTTVQSPFGANFCVRKDLLTRFPFSPDRGYRHGQLIPGEETALVSLLHAVSVKGMWLADCPVRHCLPEERNSLRYLVRRALGQGIANGLNARMQGASTRWALRGLLQSVLLAAVSALMGKPDAVSHLLEAAVLLGTLYPDIQG